MYECFTQLHNSLPSAGPQHQLRYRYIESTCDFPDNNCATDGMRQESERLQLFRRA